MKVAIFIPAFEKGGIERSMVRLSGGLIELGCEVDFLVSRTDSPLVKTIPDSVNIVSLFVPRLPSIPKLVSHRHWMSMTVLPAFVRYLRSAKPDSILAAQALTTAVLARKLSGSKARLVLRQAVNQSRWTETDPYRLSRIAPRIKKWTFNAADGVVGISEGVAGDLAQSFPGVGEKISVIYNPAADQSVLSASQDTSTLHHWLIEKTVPVTLAVGRLTAQKDFSTLLRAFAIVRSQLDSRLIILGEGEDRGRLQELIRSLGIEADVTLPGFTPNPWASMANADLLVCSSAWEGLGNILIEAMAVGTPVISTDCPSGPREILMDGELGRLVEVGDHAALADAWIAVLRDPETARATANLALDHIERFTTSGVSKQYLSVLMGA